MVFSICVGFLFFSYRDTREEITSFLQEFKIVSLSLLFLHSLHTSHILTACIKKSLHAVHHVHSLEVLFTQLFTNFI